MQYPVWIHCCKWPNYDFYISQGSVATHLRSLLIILLQISNWVRWWKNYENRLIFREVMHKRILVCFFYASQCTFWWFSLLFCKSLSPFDQNFLCSTQHREHLERAHNSQQGPQLPTGGPSVQVQFPHLWIYTLTTAGTVTAGQCMCCREDFTHCFSNFHSYYMKRDESCLVTNSPSEPKFSKFICCQKMVEIHGCNEHVGVTGEDDNPCHATVSDNMNSMRNYSDVSLFMVGVKVWVLQHFSILYRLCGYWCFIAHYPTQDDEKIIGMCCEVVHYISLYELFQFDFVCCRWPKSCMTRIVILSSNTDVFVVAMYFYHILAANGLAKLFLRGGAGDKTWFISLHVIAVSGQTGLVSLGRQPV